jgi:hypothetical protein
MFSVPSLPTLSPNKQVALAYLSPFYLEC